MFVIAAARDKADLYRLLEPLDTETRYPACNGQTIDGVFTQDYHPGFSVDHDRDDPLSVYIDMTAEVEKMCLNEPDLHKLRSDPYDLAKRLNCFYYPEYSRKPGETEWGYYTNGMGRLTSYDISRSMPAATIAKFLRLNVYHAVDDYAQLLSEYLEFMFTANLCLISMKLAHPIISKWNNVSLEKQLAEYMSEDEDNIYEPYTVRSLAGAVTARGTFLDTQNMSEIFAATIMPAIKANETVYLLTAAVSP